MTGDHVALVGCTLQFHDAIGQAFSCVLQPVIVWRVRRAEHRDLDPQSLLPIMHIWAMVIQEKGFTHAGGDIGKILCPSRPMDVSKFDKPCRNTAFPSQESGNSSCKCLGNRSEQYKFLELRSDIL